MTLDEYRALAAKLAALDDELVRLEFAASDRHTKAGSRRWRDAMRAVRNKLAVARLRLEDLACGEHGNDQGMSACAGPPPRRLIRYVSPRET